jgi:hypothetical protein
VKSEPDSTGEHLELEDLARNLQQRANDATLDIRTTTPLSREDQILIDLGRKCRGVSDELLTALDSLKLKECSHRKIQEFLPRN